MKRAPFSVCFSIWSVCSGQWLQFKRDCPITIEWLYISNKNPGIFDFHMLLLSLIYHVNAILHTSVVKLWPATIVDLRSKSLCSTSYLKKIGLSTMKCRGRWRGLNPKWAVLIKDNFVTISLTTQPSPLLYVDVQSSFKIHLCSTSVKSNLLQFQNSLQNSSNNK